MSWTLSRAWSRNSLSLDELKQSAIIFCTCLRWADDMKLGKGGLGNRTGKKWDKLHIFFSYLLIMEILDKYKLLLTHDDLCQRDPLSSPALRI